MPDVLPATTIPIYPGLSPAHGMLDWHSGDWLCSP